MSLSDPDILELNELCNAVVDGSLNDAQMQTLSRWLRDSEDARQFYVRVTGLSASLHHYASEMQTGEPDARDNTTGRRWRWVIGLLSLAASVVLLLWMTWPKPPVAPNASPVAIADADIEFAAQLTGGKDYEWASDSASIQPGGRLVKGQRVELTKGLAEITFDSGAQVVLQGPATLLVNSAWSATLSRGTLTASLPPEAMGFSISNPTVEVVDIGTEFTMVADAGGAATEVLVLKGEVEAAPRAQDDQRPIVLREKDARRFATSGVSGVHDSEQKFQELRQPRQIERFVTPIGYAHWSFDETFGDRFKAEIFGLPFAPPDVQLHDATSLTGATHAKGHVNQAMRFDGSVYAQTGFPGISENSPHTVLFWVKVPKDANASNAYAMVAWSVNNKQLGTHPIHVTWNRNANDGPWGVLRTDYGGGFAIGSTPLRDGKWHHVAVVFIPRDDPARPVECKQYVDGRLDGEGKPSTPGSEIFTASGEHAPNANGTVWLGCRLGGPHGVRYERFAGDMDELFIADGALSPPEIVQLMNANRIDE
jgi:ferric-dicitrate binding protein FerR (iron transport regulator)